MLFNYPGGGACRRGHLAVHLLVYYSVTSTIRASDTWSRGLNPPITQLDAEFAATMLMQDASEGCVAVVQANLS